MKVPKPIAPHVLVGQVWRDMDKRLTEYGGLDRFVRVRSIDEAQGVRPAAALCDSWRGSADHTGAMRPTRIALARLRPGATGYELVAGPGTIGS